MRSSHRSSSSVQCKALGQFPVWMIVFVLSITTQSQTPSPNQADEMHKLDFLVGEWKGEGWQLRPDGSHDNVFSQTTKVQTKEGNLTLRIKDSRTYKPVISSGKDTIFIPGTPVFHSSTLDATIYYDVKVNLYRWRGENSYGRKNPLEAKLINNRT